MIMAIGVFGITGVFAEEPEEDVSLAVTGIPGWDGDLTEMYEDYTQAVLTADKEGGVDCAVVVWPAFLCKDHGKPACSVCAGTDRSFITLYKANNSTTTYAKFTWKAWRVPEHGSMAEVAGQEIDVYKDKSDSLGRSGTYWKVGDYADRTDIMLIIQQVAGKERYGWVRVELTIDVLGGTPSTKTHYDWVQLRDPGPLAKKILEAYKELAKTDRYTDTYLKNLKLQTTNAERIVSKKDVLQGELDNQLTNLQLAIDGKLPGGASAGKRYKLTGWDFLDNILSDGFLRVIWIIVDIFVPIINFMGQVGKFIGFLLPFFGLLGGLLGL